MSSIVDWLKTKPELLFFGSAAKEVINDAEQRLGLVFSDEYRDYVSTFGEASFIGHELTGICTPSRLNVCAVTLEARKTNPLVPTNWYVIEETHIDGRTIWQSIDNSIWETVPGHVPQRIADSMIDYIKD